MLKKRDSFIVAVYLFLRKDNKVLLARRLNTGYEDGNYSTIAGHLELGEDVFTCLAREAKEEASITISPENTQLFHVMTRRTEEDRLDLFFTSKKWQGTPRICEPDLCDDMSWFKLNNLPDNTIPYIREVLKSIDKDQITHSRFV